MSVVENIANQLAARLDDIAAMLPDGYLITFMARLPKGTGDGSEANILLTTDEIPEVIEALQELEAGGPEVHSGETQAGPSSAAH